MTVRIFCLGDPLGCAVAGQKIPDGSHLDRKLTSAAGHGTEIGVRATGLDARGVTELMIAPAARRSSLDEVADWTL